MMTRDEFVKWLHQHATRIYVSPFDVVPCACGDANCHGWRLVPATGDSRLIDDALTRLVLYGGEIVARH